MTVQVIETRHLVRTTYVVRWAENLPVEVMLRELGQIPTGAIMEEWDMDGESRFFILRFVQEAGEP